MNNPSAPTAPSAGATLDRRNIDQLVAGRHPDPYGVLGPHRVRTQHGDELAVRAFEPGAVAAWVMADGAETPMIRLHPDGVFEACLPLRPAPFRHYRLRFRSPRGDHWTHHDPYAFPPTLSDLDLHLLGEGNHFRSWDKLGSHVRTIDDVHGVSFAVWAPNAKRVSVVGDFNHWDGRRHPMRYHPGSGFWDLFIPGLSTGVHYKYELIGFHGQLLPLRSDPYGKRFEVRPRTATIVWDIDNYPWSDQEWLASRHRRHAGDQPMAVYEVHLSSWLRDPSCPDRLLSYRELADKLVDYVKDMGYTHIQLMPITEFPYDGSWGYQTLGYFAPTSRHGEPADFMAFVDRCHRHGIGVFVDWVPAHFPRDEHGLRYFDGTALYEHSDPRQGEHPEWGTMIFNYGRNEVANFLVSSALFWLDQYHVDGLRVDAVASMLYLDYGRKAGEWVPNQYGNNHNLVAAEFIKRFNDLIHERFPDVLTIAEESTSWTGVSRPTKDGGLGFDLKWNMGWMNDTLRYFHREPVHRQHHQNDLTFSMVYAFHENFMLPLSHDEVVHGKGALLDKMPGDTWQRFANLRLLYAYMTAHPGKKLLFMGGDFGQWQEWRFQQSLDWHLLQYPAHQGVQDLVRDLNRLLRTEKSLHEVDFHWDGFAWIDFHDHLNSVLSFVRKAKDPADSILCAFNFTPVPRPGYKVGAPKAGVYEELLNSDAEAFGGSNVLNGRLEAVPEPQTIQNQPFSITVNLPPLGAVFFRVPRG